MFLGYVKMMMNNTAVSFRKKNGGKTMNKTMKLTVLLALLLLAALPLTALAASRTVDCPYIGCDSKADLIGFEYKDGETHYCIYQCEDHPAFHISSRTFKEAHNYDRKVSTSYYLASAATCTEPAKYYKSCVCGAKGTETFEVGKPMGHLFLNFVSNEDYDCTHDGTKTAKCARGCGETKTIPDPGTALGHMFIEYVSNEDYDCTHDGTKTAICENGCGETKTIPDPGTALGHMFIEYIPDGNATCKEDGTKTAICENGCGETKTIPDEGSALGTEHKFGEWYHDPHDKEGMLVRKCKVCGYEDYRYEAPETEEAAEGDSWFIVDSDKILTPEELEAMSALSPMEQVLVFTSVIGYEDQLNEVMADAEPLSEEAAKLKDSIQQRIAGLQDEEAAAFQSALDACFPSQSIVLEPDGDDYEAKLLTVRVTSGEETRDEAYGFHRADGVWSFGQL